MVHQLPADLRKALIANATAVDAWTDITQCSDKEAFVDAVAYAPSHPLLAKVLDSPPYVDSGRWLQHARS